MTYAANVHVAVYQVLDRVLRDRVAPPGVKAEVHSIIDDLRSVSASREMIFMTEAISVRLHQLDWARTHGDEAAEQQARRDLEGIAAAWLDFRIMH